MARRNRVAFRVRGVKELTGAISRYGEDVVRTVSTGAEIAVRGAVSGIRRDAPFDPTPDDEPHLQERIDGTVRYTPYGFVARIRALGVNPHLMEFGTARHAAQPFFIRHIRDARDRIEQIIAAAVARHAPRDLGTPTVRSRTGTSTTPPVGIG